MNRNKKNFQKFHEKQEKKNLPKILYLRSFSTDGSGQELEPSYIMPLANLMGNKINTHEYNLARTFLNKAHLIAVGKPGEELPELGFQRKYFPDDEWQEKVLELMKESSMIIYRPDSSDGVMWELEQIFANDFRRKLLIWTQISDIDEYVLQKARYNIFRRKVYERFHEKFPDFKRWHKYLFYNEDGILTWSVEPVNLIQQNS